ncbi:MAG: class I fructose-bisphosphate aldolase [Pseudomonadota bacterium]
MSIKQALQQTINDMVDAHRGILAMDESAPTIEKRFDAISVESTEENRRYYRSLLLDTKDLGDYISSVILFDETLTQKNDAGKLLPEVAWSQKIVPGVKVDKGKGPLPGAPGDLITSGLDGLAERLAIYREQVLHSVFHALHLHNVRLEHMILKPNMVLPGKECRRAAPQEIAKATLKVLKRTVPAAVPSVNFLSGGQGPEEATENLNSINKLRGNAPWQLSISYGRALQQPALHAWQGTIENREAAQQALLKRARLNNLARRGEYSPGLE